MFYLLVAVHGLSGHRVQQPPGAGGGKRTGSETGSGSCAGTAIAAVGSMPVPEVRTGKNIRASNLAKLIEYWTGRIGSRV